MAYWPVNNQIIQSLDISGNQLSLVPFGNTVTLPETQYISTFSEFYVGLLSTSEINLDGQTLNADATQLFLNGVPIATLENLSSISDWAFESALSDIDANGFSLVNALAVNTATLNSATANVVDINARTIQASTITAETFTATSTIQIINYLSTNDVYADDVFARNLEAATGSISTLNTSTLTTTDASIVNINGQPISSYSASNWYSFTALAAVDFGNNNINNVNTANLRTIEGASSNLVIQNTSGGAGFITLDGADGVNVDGNTGEVNITGNDVNIATTGLTSLLDINAIAGIDISAGGAVGINAIGAVEIAATGIESIGSANFTTIEGLDIDDNVITATNSAERLDIRDVSTISNSASLAITTTGATSDINLTAGRATNIVGAGDVTIRPAGQVTIGGFGPTAVSYALIGTSGGLDLFTEQNMSFTANQNILMSGFSNASINSVAGDVTISATTAIGLNSANGGISINAGAGPSEDQPVTITGSELTFNGLPVVTGTLSTISTFQQLFTSSLVVSTIVAPTLQVNATNGIELSSISLQYNGKPILTNVLETNVNGAGFNVTDVGTLRASVLEVDDIILPIGSLQPFIEIGNRAKFIEDILVAPTKKVDFEGQGDIATASGLKVTNIAQATGLSTLMSYNPSTGVVTHQEYGLGYAPDLKDYVNYVNTLYVNDNVTDIQTRVDEITSQGVVISIGAGS
jgi:hypothetical protein